MNKNVMVVFGTRPEAIKLAPVIHALKRHNGIDVTTVSTSQHRRMLDDVLTLFRITPDFDLRIMTENQSLNQIITSVITGMHQLLDRVKPDILMVQGDTSTAFAAALAAFNRQIPVGHVEAGLRTWNTRAPYPEESNRRMISVLADHHFVPTENNRKNLLNEKIADESIVVTGNTVIDALFYILNREPLHGYAGQFVKPDERLILVTAHRRESFGEPIRNICRALDRLVSEYSDTVIVYPVHLNPNIRGPVFEMLAGRERIHLIDPVDYRQVCHLMKRSYLILTDSGGIQEEAPSLGIPVLVLRDKTERPEAVEAGTVKLVGTDTETILRESRCLIENTEIYKSMSRAINPYGDGKASGRIVRKLAGDDS